MSKISLEPNTSGAGTFTLAAPNSNTNRTLALPDESGSVLTDVSDIEPQVKTATNATGDAPIYACRAWARWNDLSGATVQGSGNISSITDTADGEFTVNLTIALENRDCCVVGIAHNNVDTFSRSRIFTAAPTTTSSIHVVTWRPDTSSAVGAIFNSIAIFQ